MKKLIVVADWAADTLTVQEVRSAVEGFLLDPTHPNISFISTSPSTIHTSFILAQLIEIEERYGRPLDSVFFQNTDPRLDTTNPVEKSKGSELMIIRLKSGIHILGPNAGYDFSLIKDKIEMVFTYPGLDVGSQFRSRDLYSRVAAHLMDSLEDDLELEEAHSNLIPEIEGSYIGHIDNYGNIKTTLKDDSVKESFRYGDEVSITINGTTKKAQYAENLFSSTTGNLILYPGSSGPKDNPYLEISSWADFGADTIKTGVSFFENLTPGMKIEIR